jgi:hypothetical protein
MANPIQTFIITIDDDLGVGWNYSCRSLALAKPITAAEVLGAADSDRPDLRHFEGQMYVSGESSQQWNNGSPSTLGHTMYIVTNGVLVRRATDGFFWTQAESEA